MSDQSVLEKIQKLDEKKNSKKIIKLMEGKHADEAVICAALNALADIGDEDAVNHITHFISSENANIRVAACKAGVKIGSEYMSTQVRYQMSKETDPQIKAEIQKALDAK